MTNTAPSPVAPKTSPAPAAAQIATEVSRAKNTAVPAISVNTAMLAVEDIQPDPANRKDFDADALTDLSNSVASIGVLQPILVRLAGGNGPKYMIEAGERRWRAAKQAGLTQIPAIVRDDTAADVLVVRLVENLHRENLKLPEKCDAITQLVKQIGVGNTALKTGLSVSAFSKLAGVVDMPEKVKQLIRNGDIIDVEIASSLTQLNKIDAARTDRVIMGHRNGWTELSRESVGAEVKRAKEQKETEAREAEEKKKAELAEQKRKAAGLPAPKPQLSKEEQKQREQGRAIERVKQERKDLRHACLDRIYSGLQLDKKKLESFDRPVGLDYGSDFGSYGHKAPPKTVDAVSFTFNTRGNVALLKRVAAGFSKKPLVDVKLPQLTLEQAQRVEDALKDIAHKLNISFAAEITGADLKSITERLAPSNKPPLPVMAKPKGAGTTIKSKTAKKAARTRRSGK